MASNDIFYRVDPVDSQQASNCDCLHYTQAFADFKTYFTSYINITDIPKVFLDDINRSLQFNHKDILGILSIFITFICLRYFLSPIALSFFTKQLGISRKNAYKCFYNAWHGCYYLTSTLLMSYLFFVHKDGSMDRYQQYYIENIQPALKQGNGHNNLEYFLALFTIAYYLDCIYWLLTSRGTFRQKDTNVLLVHHVMSIVAMVCSYMAGGVRYALYVFIHHDPCDIFISTTKIFDGLTTSVNSPKLVRLSRIGRVISFMLLPVSWFYLRLYRYPVCASPITVGCPLRTQFMFPFVTQLAFIQLLILIMNYYWAYFILRTCVRLIQIELVGTKTSLDARDFESSKPKRA